MIRFLVLISIHYSDVKGKYPIDGLTLTERDYIISGTIWKLRNYLKRNGKIISVSNIPLHIPQSCQL